SETRVPDQAEAGPANLARHRYRREPTSAARCPGLENGLGQEGMEARRRSPLHRSGGRAARRGCLGTTRSTHADVPVSAAQVGSALHGRRDRVSARVVRTLKARVLEFLFLVIPSNGPAGAG